MSTYDTIAKDYTDPTPKPRKRWAYVGSDDEKPTVADAVVFCRDHGLDATQVQLAHRHVSWDDVETPEEVASRTEWGTNNQREHVAKIRELYQEYESRGLYDDLPESDDRR